MEITTGPLGQGLANAVGMAMAARRERGLFDPDAAPGESPFDHHIYVFASDGDMEEGVTHEASSLAGHQELGNLIVFYDDNEISIEDDTKIALSEDIAARYEAYGWHVQTVAGPARTSSAPRRAIEARQRPRTAGRRSSCCAPIIGWPAPHKQNTGAAHGSALGADEVAATKEILGFDPHSPSPSNPRCSRTPGRSATRGRPRTREWQQPFDAWAAGQPEPRPRCSTGCRPAAAGRAGPSTYPPRAGPEGPGDPQGLRRSAQRARRGTAGAVGRLGRPR